MTPAVYRHPAGGFATLWPPRRLGTDLSKAVVATGNGPSIAYNRGCPVWAIWVTEAGRAGHAQRLQSSERGAALAEVRDRFDGGGAVRVVLMRAVCTSGARVLFAQTDEFSFAQSDTLLAAPGLLLKAKLDPILAQDFRTIARNLGADIAAAGGEVVQPALNDFVDRLQSTDWTKLSPAQQRKALADATAALKASHALQERAAVQIAKPALLRTARDTKAGIKARYLGGIGVNLRAPEVASVERIAVQQGWFVRNQAKQIDAALTERARVVVAEGLAQGLGREDIGAALRDQVPGMWEGMGRRYANLIAANAVARARSYTQLSTFQGAGVAYMEVVAMLDEKTSEICRCMDGQIIPVEGALGVAQAAASVASPEGVYAASPFLQMTAGPKDEQLLTVRGTGTPIAEVTRSGMGGVDDRGEMNQFVGGTAMPGQNIGAPPYHHNCRSTVVPRTDIAQVPAGYDMRAGLSDPEKNVDTLLNTPVETFAAPAPSAPVVEPRLDPGALPPEAMMPEGGLPGELPGSLPAEEFAGSYADLAVQADVYGARLPGQQLADFRFQRHMLASRSGDVAANGSFQGDTAWNVFQQATGESIQSSLRRTLETAGNSRQVSLVLNSSVDPNASMGRYAITDILDAQREVPTGAKRDYIIHDFRGRALFMRVDGAKLAKMETFDYNAFTGSYRTYSSKAAEWMKEAGVEITDDLRAFYPKAEINWKRQRNLIPGVPLGEQVEARMSAIEAEVRERMLKRHGTADIWALTEEQVGTLYSDVIRQGAAETSPSLMIPNRVAIAEKTAGGKASIKARAKAIREEAEVKASAVRTVSPQAHALLMDCTYDHCAAPLMRAIEADGSPAWFAVNSSKVRPFYIPMPADNPVACGAPIALGASRVTEIINLAPKNKINVTGMTGAAALEDAQHEATHHISRVGMNNHAARIARNRQAVDGPLVKVGSEGDEWALPGKYRDAYAGKLYGKELEIAQEIAADNKGIVDIARFRKETETMAQMFKENEGQEYASMLMQNIREPVDFGKRIRFQGEQSGAFLVAMMRGAFVPY